MVYAPWVNEWFDNIAGAVVLDDVGGFFRLSSNTWELQGVDEEPDMDGDTVLSQIIYYEAPDDADIIEDSEQLLIEQEHFEFQCWSLDSPHPDSLDHGVFLPTYPSIKTYSHGSRLGAKL